MMWSVRQQAVRHKSIAHRLAIWQISQHQICDYKQTKLCFPAPCLHICSAHWADSNMLTLCQQKMYDSKGPTLKGPGVSLGNKGCFSFCTTLVMISCSFSPTQGFCPVHISHSRMPNAYTSAACMQTAQHQTRLCQLCITAQLSSGFLRCAHLPGQDARRIHNSSLYIQIFVST